MHTTTRRLLASTATVVALLPMGGTGDFYKHYSCGVNAGSTANLDVTNYDIATGQRYHIDIDSGGFKVNGLYIDGVKQPAWNDVYKDYKDRSSVHTIKGVWEDGWSTPSCALRF